MDLQPLQHCGDRVGHICGGRISPLRGAEHLPRCLPANRKPATWEIVAGYAVFLVALLHKTLADRELAEFKRRNDKGVLLDYGYHAACRHPNYFFNTFPFPCVGLMSGSYAVAGMWLIVQVFWAHAQSGMSLEGYTEENYGEAWEKYCKSVPFFFRRLVMC